MQRNLDIALEPEFRPVSPMGVDHFDSDFEFPTTVSDTSTNPALQNDIVFCGKVLIPQTKPESAPKNPFLIRLESFGKQSSGRSDALRSLSSGRKSSGGWKRFNGLFGMLQFPVQMELSDIKKRQGRREPLPLPKLPVDRDGELLSPSAGKSCWELIRPLSRRGHLMSALAKVSFGCIPLV